MGVGVGGGGGAVHYVHEILQVHYHVNNSLKLLKTTLGHFTYMYMYVYTHTRIHTHAFVGSC